MWASHFVCRSLLVFRAGEGIALVGDLLYMLTWKSRTGYVFDADSLALIELVEGIEEELAERAVGFRIEDEDLEDLRSVRDAVDYVVAKLG